MSFFKLSMPTDPDMLPLYTQTASPAQAKQRVERLLGPLKGVKVEEVKERDIPEGTTLI